MQSPISHFSNDALLHRPDDGVLEIAPPEGSKVRARRIVTRSRARATGKYPSWKVGRMVQWESSNELNAFRLLDANPHVRTFREQPMWITYRLGGELFLHIPDALVETDVGREVWEVKPTDKAVEPQCAERSRLLTQALPALGYFYRVVLAEDLRRQPRLSNVLQLLKYGRREMTVAERECLRRVIAPVGLICWGAGTSTVLGTHGRALIARAFLEGALTTDIEQPLTNSTSFKFVATTSIGGSNGHLLV